VVLRLDVLKKTGNLRARESLVGEIGVQFIQQDHGEVRGDGALLEAIAVDIRR
jgi:hypothetical protein